jgi:hypothetical protein
MVRGIVAAVLALSVVSLDAVPVGAAECMPREMLVSQLNEKFSETRVAFGLAGDQSNQRLVEIYAADAGTWTVIISDPRGIACIVIAGHSFTRPPPPGDPM